MAVRMGDKEKKGLACCTAGAKVILNGRRSDVLKNTAAEIDPRGENIAWVAGDIGKAETRQRMVSSATSRFGGVNILFNNAGVFFIYNTMIKK